MLKRHIDILDYLIVIADLGDQLVGDLIGIAIKYSQPRNIGLLAYSMQELMQTILAVKILAVSCGVLRYDAQLLDTKLGKSLCLLDKLVDRS